MLETHFKIAFDGIIDNALPLVNKKNLVRLAEYYNKNYGVKVYSVNEGKLWSSFERDFGEVDVDVLLADILVEYCRADYLYDDFHECERFLLRFLLITGDFSAYDKHKTDSVAEMKEVLTSKKFNWRKFDLEYPESSINGEYYIYLLAEIVKLDLK